MLILVFVVGFAVGALVGATGICAVLYALGRREQKAAAAEAVRSFSERLEASAVALRHAPDGWHDGRRH